MLRVVKIFVAAIIAVLAYSIVLSALFGLFVLSVVLWIFDKTEGQECIEFVVNAFKELHVQIYDEYFKS